jgi:CheY-like chemotaxis protein
MKTHFPIVAVECGKGERSGGGEVQCLPKVLLVGLEPAIDENLVKILPLCGFSVLTVPDEKEALEIAALIPPDLLIVVVPKPEIKWLALTMAMKQAIPKCDVLLLFEPLWPTRLAESVGVAGHSFVTVA